MDWTSDPAIEARNPISWATARAWTPQAGPNLFIQGNVGTGKTFMGRYLLWKVRNAGFSTEQILGQELVDLCRAFDDRLAPYRKAAVLLADDLTAASWTARALSSLHRLLDYRYESGFTYTARDESGQLVGRLFEMRRRTIFSANANFDALAGMWRKVRDVPPPLPDSIIDRMWPVCVLDMTGPSLRRELLHHNVEGLL